MVDINNAHLKKAYRPTPGSRKFVIQHTTANSRGRMGNMMASSIESSSSTSGTSSVSQERRLSTYRGGSPGVEVGGSAPGVSAGHEAADACSVFDISR